jgi:hypothetical protein
MAKYYVNKNAQSNGDHEVHVSTCSFLPDTENRLYLGEFSHCRNAVAEAKKTHRQSTAVITVATNVIRRKCYVALKGLNKRWPYT